MPGFAVQTECYPLEEKLNQTGSSDIYCLPPHPAPRVLTHNGFYIFWISCKILKLGRFLQRLEFRTYIWKRAEDTATGVVFPCSSGSDWLLLPRPLLFGPVSITPYCLLPGPLHSFCQSCEDKGQRQGWVKNTKDAGNFQKRERGKERFYSEPQRECGLADTVVLDS